MAQRKCFGASARALLHRQAMSASLGTGGRSVLGVNRLTVEIVSAGMCDKADGQTQAPLAGECTTMSEEVRVQALLSIYQVERQDQQTSGIQSRALIGTGLAYAAGIAALLATSEIHAAPALVLLATPLPLIALIALQVLGIGNILQRARYLEALERELESHLSLPDGKQQRFRLTVPNGFRRSELVFAPSATRAARYIDNGASGVLRAIASYALGALTQGIMFLIEVGLSIYVVHLVSGVYRTAGIVIYAACLLLNCSELLLRCIPVNGRRVHLWKRADLHLTYRHRNSSSPIPTRRAAFIPQPTQRADWRVGDKIDLAVLPFSRPKVCQPARPRQTHSAESPCADITGQCGGRLIDGISRPTPQNVLEPGGTDASRPGSPGRPSRTWIGVSSSTSTTTKCRSSSGEPPNDILGGVLQRRIGTISALDSRHV